MDRKALAITFFSIKKGFVAIRSFFLSSSLDHKFSRVPLNVLSAAAKILLGVILARPHSKSKYLENTIPFEIHITTSDLTKGRQNDFINFCTKIDAKPLVIELSKGKFIKQPMFSKVIHSNSIDNVLSISNQLSRSLILQNFNMERLKIEIPAENYNLFENYKSTFLNYFEWHGKIDYIQIDNLNDLCRTHKVHLSLNSLKNESNTRFVTLREFGTKLEFENRVNELTKDLKKGNWTIFKHESEYCIYDNNSFLDTGWLPQ